MSNNKINDRNPNFLSPINFKFKLSRAPNLNFFIQKITVPDLTLPDVSMSNPLITYPFPGDHLTYGDLTMTFKVDENLQNYMEVQNWMRGLGKPSGAEYAALAAQPSYLGMGLRSDISLTILTSNKNPNYEIVFKDAFPTQLSGMEFLTTATDVDYLEASATFKYLIYDITKII